MAEKPREAGAEAAKKRRIARQVNTLLTSQPGGKKKLDGRTEKRRRRLIEEIKGGRGGVALKPMEKVAHADELIRLGETLSSLKAQGIKLERTQLTPEAEQAILQAQEAYGFHPKAWKLLGIDIKKLANPH
ncbi:MAG: hypothetical protein JW797_17950 [Bradymonadales bacterium]|nr:hypothetical protein [Bradymonadales bacterium]